MPDNSGVYILYHYQNHHLALFDDNFNLIFEKNFSSSIGGIDVTLNQFFVDGGYELIYTQTIDNVTHGYIINENNNLLYDFPGISTIKIDHTTGLSDKLFVNIGAETDVYGFSTDSTTAASEPKNLLLTISPNPFSDQFRISVPTNKPFDLFISDMNGRMVYTRKECTTQDLSVVPGTLPKGMYEVSAITEEGVYYGKIVRQ